MSRRLIKRRFKTITQDDYALSDTSSDSSPNPSPIASDDYIDMSDFMMYLKDNKLPLLDRSNLSIELGNMILDRIKRLKNKQSID